MGGTHVWRNTLFDTLGKTFWMDSVFIGLRADSPLVNWCKLCKSSFRPPCVVCPVCCCEDTTPGTTEVFQIFQISRQHVLKPSSQWANRCSLKAFNIGEYLHVDGDQLHPHHPPFRFSPRTQFYMKAISVFSDLKLSASEMKSRNGSELSATLSITQGFLHN